MPIVPAASRPLIFVNGKGGTGKTRIAHALALASARRGNKTLLACFEDPFLPVGRPEEIAPKLTRINCDAAMAFEEYVGLKLGVPALTRLFVRNSVIHYLSQAAPGIRDLVLLGKVWHERENYARIIVDMPSTGHGIAMFQSMLNFSELFQGGPLHRDAHLMRATFNDPEQTGFLVLGIPEEMPLQEGLELSEQLTRIFSANAPELVCNRRFPRVDGTSSFAASKGPFAQDARDYAVRRRALEDENLALWRGKTFAELPYLPPGEDLDARLSNHMLERGWLA